MKKILMVVLLTTGFINGYAQSKLIATMLQQIAANAAHIAQIEKGYEIAKEGLHFISSAKHGELDLHSGFFASLKGINPNIKKMSKLAAIIAMQLQVVKNYKVHYKQLRESNQFSATEIDYIYSVFTKLMDNTSNAIEELIKVTTADNYVMHDDERIKRIDGLYKLVQGDYLFEQQFSNETLTLAIQRKQELNETQTSKALNGIK